MKRLATVVGGLFALLAVAGTASGALRVPQAPVTGGALQSYLNAADGGINVLTDQQDIQRWQSATGGNTNFTLQLELGPFSPNNTIGLYNAGLASPTLYLVFPGIATPGWFAMAAFRTGPARVVVTLFDASTTFQGSTTYMGADQTNFGFYLSGPGGTFYTEDSRNPGGAAQALTFSGTQVNSGSWWLCWDDQQISGGPGDSSFDNAVLFLQAVAPTPVARTTWGQLKARFR
jgi:hypothetical protein